MEAFKQIYDEEKREQIFQDNLRQIKQCLENVDPEVIRLNEHLISEAAMYATSLDEVNALIKRDGIVDLYKNGANQFGTKKSVAAELKPKYTATYQSLIKQLSELLPSGEENAALSELRSFIKR